MAAYVIAIREKTLDESQLKTYSEKVGPTFEGRTVKRLARYGRCEVVEGPHVEGVVILEFPTFEEAKAWYDSPGYREAREYRFKGGKYHFMIVQGL